MPEVRLRPERAADSDRGLLGLALLAALTGAALWTRPLWTPRPPDGQLVEVRGEVAAPGTYLVDPPTLAAAVEAAGGLSQGVPDTPLAPGDAVLVGFGGVRVVPAGDPLLVAIPVNVNVHGRDALAAVPGLSGALADRIVAERDLEPFWELDDLARVPGIDVELLDAAAPFLTVGDPGPRPALDLNTATARQLERLPGIGPALAARIVEDRDARGPFADLAALARVRGVGARTLEALEGRAGVR